MIILLPGCCHTQIIIHFCAWEQNCSIFLTAPVLLKYWSNAPNNTHNKNIQEWPRLTKNKQVVFPYVFMICFLSSDHQGSGTSVYCPLPKTRDFTKEILPSGGGRQYPFLVLSSNNFNIWFAKLSLHGTFRQIHK